MLKTVPHNLEEYLVADLDGACVRDDPKGPLFRTMGRGTGRLTRNRSLPQAFGEKIEVRGVNPMLVRKKAKACGIVLYGIVLGLVVGLPGCNNTESEPWPPIWSKAEQEALCRLPGHCGRPTPLGSLHGGE
jgi:hypothetical protein